MSVGKILDNMKVVIADSNSNRICGNNEIGEICLQSDSIGSGYWDNPNKTTETFKVRLEGQEGYFLRTGDLGIVYEDELYIVGRLRDMLIINGHNIYPQDIEFNLKQDIPELNSKTIVSFSTSANGKERVIVCIESDNNIDFERILV